MIHRCLGRQGRRTRRHEVMVSVGFMEARGRSTCCSLYERMCVMFTNAAKVHAHLCGKQCLVRAVSRGHAPFCEALCEALSRVVNSI